MGLLGLAPQSPAQDSSVPASVVRPAARWVAVDWKELPGFQDDALAEAWNAWVLSCQRPPTAFQALCNEVRQLSIGSAGQQRDWITQRLQAYRVESLQGDPVGLLTGYYEPEYDASRQAASGFSIPLYRAPASLPRQTPWFSRQEIDTLPQSRTALLGHELAWLSDPIDALVLQIQGSGRLRLKLPDGSQQRVRLAFAGSNNHPYRSVGRWLLDRGEIREASWSAIRAWALQNPERLNDMLWSNPRFVFFREEPMGPSDIQRGPKGAQGVELTPGRSIAVDRESIPYGTPVWMVSDGPSAQLRRLVIAQDTGSAIVGAVRADYFAGWGDDAEDLAGRLKQSLKMWVLWPKGAAAP